MCKTVGEQFLLEPIEMDMLEVQTMAFKDWHLAVIEDYGYTDTNDGLINRVARNLAGSPNDTINTEEFRQACIACNVDPDSFTQSDLDQLQRKLDEIT